MMGGILVATVLTILVLPAGYALFFGREPKTGLVKENETSRQDTAESVHAPALAAE
jgi:hypothetical protein